LSSRMARAAAPWQPGLRMRSGPILLLHLRQSTYDVAVRDDLGAPTRCASDTFERRRRSGTWPASCWVPSASHCFCRMQRWAGIRPTDSPRGSAWHCSPCTGSFDPSPVIARDPRRMPRLPSVVLVVGGFATVIPAYLKAAPGLGRIALVRTGGHEACRSDARLRTELHCRPRAHRSPLTSGSRGSR
jgi:hypothetical protein